MTATLLLLISVFPTATPISVEQQASIELDGIVRGVAISPDGKMLACSCNGDVHLFRVDDGSRLRTLRGHTALVRCVDGQTLLSSAWDNTVRLWDAKTGRQLLKVAGANDEKGFRGAVFSPDGSSIVSVTGKGTIQIWDAIHGKLLASVKGSDKTVSGLAVSPTGMLAATFGREGTVTLWSIKWSE